MKRIVVVMASLGLLLGIGFAFAAAWSWFDPVGMQIANDADSFGAPPSRGESAYVLIFAAAVVAVSAHRLWFGRRSNDRSDGDDDA